MSEVDNSTYIVITRDGTKAEVNEGWCTIKSNAQYFVESEGEDIMKNNSGCVYTTRTPESRVISYPGFTGYKFISSVHYEAVPYLGCNCDETKNENPAVLYVLIENKKIIGWIEDESQAKLLAKYSKAISYEALTLLRPEHGDIPEATEQEDYVNWVKQSKGAWKPKTYKQPKEVAAKKWRPKKSKSLATLERTNKAL